MTYDDIVKEYKIELFEALIDAPRSTCVVPRFLMWNLKSILTAYGVKDKVRTNTRMEVISLLVACGYTDRDGDGRYIK